MASVVTLYYLPLDGGQGGHRYSLFRILYPQAAIAPGKRSVASPLSCHPMLRTVLGVLLRRRWSRRIQNNHRCRGSVPVSARGQWFMRANLRAAADSRPEPTPYSPTTSAPCFALASILPLRSLTIGTGSRRSLAAGQSRPGDSGHVRLCRSPPAGLAFKPLGEFRRSALHRGPLAEARKSGTASLSMLAHAGKRWLVATENTAGNYSVGIST